MFAAQLETTRRESRPQNKRKLLDWRVCAITNIVSLFVLCAWIILDADLTGISSDSNTNIIHAFRSFGYKVAELDESRRFAMFVILTLAIVSAIGWLGVTLFGQLVSRSIRSWMAITMAVAIWMASVGNWHELAWQGENQRAIQYTKHFEGFLSKLRTEWPRKDGQSSDLGPYLAYNTPASKSLLLLSCPPMPKGVPTFNGVERTPEGGMAFSLVGTDGGDWLEWHTTASQPTSFVTGLQQPLTLRRSSWLGNGWYLVRYKN